MAAAAVGFRLVLVLFGGDLHLSSRPEVSTPVTSLRRRKHLLTLSILPLQSPAPRVIIGRLFRVYCSGRRLLAEAGIHVPLFR